MNDVSRAFAAARIIELGREESLALPAGLPMPSRVPLRALPVLCPVDHVVDGDRIVLRSHTGAHLLDHIRIGEVVVYEADHLQAHTRAGWSDHVTGPATPITTPLEVARYRRLLISHVPAAADLTTSCQQRIRIERVGLCWPLQSTLAFQTMKVLALPLRTAPRLAGCLVPLTSGKVWQGGLNGIRTPGSSRCIASCAKWRAAASPTSWRWRRPPCAAARLPSKRGPPRDGPCGPGGRREIAPTRISRRDEGQTAGHCPRR